MIDNVFENQVNQFQQSRSIKMRSFLVSALTMNCMNSVNGLKISIGCGNIDATVAPNNTVVNGNGNYTKNRNKDINGITRPLESKEVGPEGKKRRSSLKKLNPFKGVAKFLKKKIFSGAKHNAKNKNTLASLASTVDATPSTTADAGLW